MQGYILRVSVCIHRCMRPLKSRGLNINIYESFNLYDSRLPEWVRIQETFRTKPREVKRHEVPVFDQLRYRAPRSRTLLQPVPGEAIA